MRRVRDAGIGLKRALVRSAEAAGGSIEVLEDDFTAWSSHTFNGGRHLIKLAGLWSPPLDAWLERLADCELAIPGHLVATMAVVARASAGGRTEAHIEVLTVEERR